MKNYRLFIFLIILMVGVSISSVSGIDSNQIVNGLNASSDLNQSLMDAEAQNKTVMLLFDQDSCYYCDLLKKDVLSNSNVQKELNDKCIVVDIDVNKQPQLAAKYKVVGTPMIVFLDSNSNEIHKIEGYVSADEFLNSIKEI